MDVVRAGWLLGLVLIATAVPIAASAENGSRSLLDLRTRAFANVGGDCVGRAHKIWRSADPNQPVAYVLDIQVVQAKCLLDLRSLADRDRRGDWKPFETSAKQGERAIRGFGLGLVYLTEAIQSKSKRAFNTSYNKAVAETKLAFRLWREAGAGINKVRAKAGLPRIA